MRYEGFKRRVTRRLRRYGYHTQQIIALPYYRWRRRRIVHFIHPNRTGGTALKDYILSFGRKTPNIYIILHGHNFRLSDVPEGELAIITLRDPVERYLSCYDRSYEKYVTDPLWQRLFNTVRPRWTKAMRMFDANELTKYLANGCFGMRHFRHPQSWWFSGKIKCMYIIMRTEHLQEDLTKITQFLNLPPVQLPSGMSKNASIRRSRELIEAAAQRVLQWEASGKIRT